MVYDLPPEVQCDDDSDGGILDAAALADLGHSEEEIGWLLGRAIRGSSAAPYLTADEHERLLVDLRNGEPHQ
jgi:hypothetical protein